MKTVFVSSQTRPKQRVAKLRLLIVYQNWILNILVVCLGELSAIKL